MVNNRAIVGPYSDRDSKLAEHWGWIYFHGEAELVNSEYCAQQGLGIAPDLVSSDTPLETIDDGFYLVQHVSGEGLFLHLWSRNAEWRNGKPRVMRHGLIVHPDDTESDEYAEKCRKEKRDWL